MSKSIYLDYAAATPLDSQVLAAMMPYFAEKFYNPSADYEPARQVRSALQDSRSKIAQILGAKPAEVIFTAGATEANNLAIRGVMQKHFESSLAISAIEHESVRAPAANYQHKIIGVDEKGLIDVSSVSKYIDESTVLVSIMYANNEVGTVQPIRRISAEIESIRKDRQKKANVRPLYLHIDAAQAGNYLDLQVHRLGVDLMTINGGKIYGPKQSGALFVRAGVDLLPVIEGGGQERGLRSGTENIAGCVGLAVALDMATKLRHEESTRVALLRDQLMDGLVNLKKDIIINGSTKHRLPNNLHITIPGIDNERLLMALDEKGIYAAAGSACSASSDEPSHVLKAMGCSDNHIRSSVRFSLGRQSTGSNINAVLKEFQKALN